MLYWVEQIALLLPVLGFEFLRELPKIVVTQDSGLATATASSRLNLELRDNRTGVLARAFEADGEYIVLSGSTARAGGEYINTYAGLRQQLIDAGKLSKTDDPKLLSFTQDVTFTSPSAASAVILNRNDNGRTSWRVTPSGKTLAEWQNEQAARAAAAAEKIGPEPVISTAVNGVG